ncbi:RluA family pseudouridine synthase [Neptuniibacter sp.]|uniref:RluA family pseudouridine synthase n=1 Tax=Neptuniibacter sp. TaxID=1962643 RepID=UPI003B5A15B9
MDGKLSSDPLGFRLCFEAYQAEPSLFNFLYARLSKNHQQQLPQLFEDEHVSVDGEVATSKQSLKAGQKVEVFLSDHQEEPVDDHWKVLWENNELMAAYKPHLLPVSRTTRNLYNTLISLIRRQTPYANAHLLHRLDTETAGIVLIAKNNAADKKWKPNLDKLITRKIYHAWVSGSPEWDEHLCECALSEKIDSPIRSQIYVVDPENPQQYPKPKQSKTAFRVLKREQRRSLIECELFTGRKHQIRAQLAYLGHPIIGDKIYSQAGKFYLKRLESGLTDQDFTALGAISHRLTAVEIEINTDDERYTISI